MKACILDAGSLGPDITLDAILETPFEWTVWNTSRADEVKERIAEVQLVLSNKAPLNRDSLRHASQLRYISVLATGTNNVDLEAARDLSIQVSNVRHYSTEAVVQHTLSFLLALSGQLLSYHTDVKAYRWQGSPHFCYFNRPIHDLRGQVLTIVGYGSQGRRLAAVASQLGMDVRLVGRDRSGGIETDGFPRRSLAELLPLTDVLSFHCPLTPETQHLLHAGNILQLKKGALVINCARGGLIDEEALASALECGHLGGAGIDVLAAEPPSFDHPLMKVKHPNFIMTPHIAWASLGARRRLVEETAENIRTFLRGTPRNVVGP